MSRDQAFEIALALMKLGVSNRGVEELLASFPYDQIERQLQYLPFRKAKRPEAFIIDAVRNNYSPPKEFYYAKDHTQPPQVERELDQGSKLSDPNPDAHSLGHRTADLASDTPVDSGLEPSRRDDHDPISQVNEVDWAEQ